MMELFLNLTWLALAVALLATAARRGSLRTVTAVVFIIALLFPIISATDDLLSSDSADAPVAALVETIVLGFGLVAIASVAFERRRMAAFLLATHSDPRSPPRV